jgi:hypothetical protein
VRAARHITIALGLLAALPACAAAQDEEGVFRDPDSIAGKEYALPFDAGRRLGAGSDAPDREGTAPSFGIGIKPPGPPGPEEAPAREDRGHRGERSGEEPAPPPTPPAATRERDGGNRLSAAGDLDGDGTSGITAGILAAILLGGGSLGLALRMLGRRSSSTA